MNTCFHTQDKMKNKEKVYYPEFFNDVFGPVMQPGSSSHTAGPCRIGYIANSLIGGRPCRIRIILDPDGSFAGTFGHMNEDLGMLAGAYGLLPDDERIFDIKQILQKENIEWNIDFLPIEESNHPNSVKFELHDKNNNLVTVTGISTGGGRIRTVCINDIPFEYNGDREVPFRLKINGIETVRNLPCILTVSVDEQEGDQLFDNFEEWIRISEVENRTLAEVACVYEKRASGWSEKDIRAYMRKLMGYMMAQTDSVYHDETNILETPFSGYHFRKWEEYKNTSNEIIGDVISKAIYYMFGVQALTKTVKMVPGPMGTGGGFLFSCFRALAEKEGYSEDQMIDGLLVAAGVGAICYSRTDPTGEMTGCAGECGVCGAMTSAGLTYLQGGSVRQVEAAASMALQMALGWPCDPIPGGYNQPCISRVTTIVTMAFVFSQLALSNQNAVIPFHEVVDIMDRMGHEMPSKYKCTSCGGICESPSAVKCKDEFVRWHRGNR